MTALTKLMKEGIVSGAVKQACKEQREALSKDKAVFAEQVYEDQRAHLGFAELLATKHAKEWLSMTRDVKIYGPNHGVVRAATSKILLLFARERYNNCIELRLDKESKFLSVYDALYKRAAGLVSFESELMQKVNALLVPMKTFAQFRLMWPEGVSLLPPEPGKTYTLVDAKLMLSVNAIVGLPPGVVGE